MRIFIIAVIIAIEAHYNFIELSNTVGTGYKLFVGFLIIIGMTIAAMQDYKELKRSK